MTLDEAIKHCEEKAKAQRNQADYYHRTRKSDNDEYRNGMRDNCLERANEHEQLADWLNQLKQVQDVVEHWNDKSSSFVSACNAFEDILHIFGKGVGDKE